MASRGEVMQSITNNSIAAAPIVMPVMPVAIKFMSTLYQTSRVM